MTDGSIATEPRRHVRPRRAIPLVFRVVLRELATRGRIIWLSLISLLSAFAGLMVGLSDDPTVDDAVRLISLIGLAIVVPFVALFFAGAAIGDMRDDKTLVYLWLRPIDRWPIVVGAAFAAIALAAPIAIVPTTAGAALTGVGEGIVGGTLLACTVGLLAYVGVFTLLGVWLKGWIWWGLGYVLIWEGFIAQGSVTVARFSIRRYARSILVETTGAEVYDADFGFAMSIVVPLVAAVVAIVVASWRLGTQDID